MADNKRSGRPKKAEEDKVSYQRIAVYTPDYQRLATEIEKRNIGRDKKDKIKLATAFTTMVDKYIKKK